MHFFLAVIIVIIAMAVRDVLGTALVTYEARSQANLAGIMDGLGDLANFVYMLVGIDELQKTGFSLQSTIMLLAVSVTSYTTTKFTVQRLAKKGELYER